MLVHGIYLVLSLPLAVHWLVQDLHSTSTGGCLLHPFRAPEPHQEHLLHWLVEMVLSHIISQSTWLTFTTVQQICQGPQTVAALPVQPIMIPDWIFFRECRKPLWFWGNCHHPKLMLPILNIEGGHTQISGKDVIARPYQLIMFLINSRGIMQSWSHHWTFALVQFKGIQVVSNIMKTGEVTLMKVLHLVLLGYFVGSSIRKRCLHTTVDRTQKPRAENSR